ncbi:hypothetical protein ACFFTM_15465 [Pseudoduganella plicata]|uniref:Uncharacterized protein n=1 Tax=Pseudoduganella plicata TaxID=321984 RepID=A0A4P7BN14_9BURK|nr:hypothetical protein [Pseudoduganella plicata]QBQ39165.1 hypothetical protein E1742_25795 [Pseudoduganella plicata]GGY87866.1 hypothetical protein GCM10007388_21570 [Pseudoduganella plicata]
MKRSVFAVLAALCVTGVAHAKLPVPTEEQQAAAAAAKDKAAWGDKVSTYKLCQAQDRVVAYYAKTNANAKVTPSATSACVDPGPYQAKAQAQAEVGIADSKPVPAAGALQPGAMPKK